MVLKYARPLLFLIPLLAAQNGMARARDCVRENLARVSPSFAPARAPKAANAPAAATRALTVENGDVPVQAFRMHYDPVIDPERMILEYAKVLEKIPGAEVWVVAQPQHLSRLDQTLRQVPPEVRRRFRVRQVSADKDLKAWAQDGSKSLSGGPKRRVLQPRGMIHESAETYQEANRALQEAGDLAIEPSSVDFEGGDVVVGERHAFVGMNVVRGVMKDRGVDESEALDILSAEFGRKAHPIGASNGLGYGGKTKEPVHFHIDLTMAIVRDRQGGGEVAFVSSPAKFFEALGGSPPRSFKELQTQIRSTLTRLRTSARLTPQKRALIEFLQTAPPEAIWKELTQTLEVRDDLRRLGYRVEELPGISRPREDLRWKGIKYYNYVNSVFTGQHALVPELGIPELDGLARRGYRNLGYDVIPMQSAQSYLCFSGGTRCAIETVR